MSESSGNFSKLLKFILRHKALAGVIFSVVFSLGIGLGTVIAGFTLAYSRDDITVKGWGFEISVVARIKQLEEQLKEAVKEQARLEERNKNLEAQEKILQSQLQAKNENQSDQEKTAFQNLARELADEIAEQEKTIQNLQTRLQHEKEYRAEIEQQSEAEKYKLNKTILSQNSKISELQSQLKNKESTPKLSITQEDIDTLVDATGACQVLAYSEKNKNKDLFKDFMGRANALERLTDKLRSYQELLE